VAADISSINAITDDLFFGAAGSAPVTDRVFSNGFE